MSSDTALVVIDVQVGVFESAYGTEEVLGNINTLLAKARAAGTPVIYVQHEEPEEPGLVVGTPQWQIHPVIAPQEGELVVHKRASDSFHETNLKDELEKRGIKHLVVTGGQTDYCVNATVRRATTSGYNVTLVGDAHTTEDSENMKASQIIEIYNHTLNGFGTDTAEITVKPTREITF